MQENFSLFSSLLLLLSDTATLLDMDESNLDARISELEELLRNSYNEITTTTTNDELTNDDTITLDRIKPCSSVLHDSTHTLCPQDPFSDCFEDDEHENEVTNNGLVVRSNSLGIVQMNRKAALLEKAPKKVVRFADMLVRSLITYECMIFFSFSRV